MAEGVNTSITSINNYHKMHVHLIFKNTKQYTDLSYLTLIISFYLCRPIYLVIIELRQVGPKGLHPRYNPILVCWYFHRSRELGHSTLYVWYPLTYFQYSCLYCSCVKKTYLKYIEIIIITYILALAFPL